jgi:hypothetical protein
MAMLRGELGRRDDERLARDDQRLARDAEASRKGSTPKETELSDARD